MTHLDLKSARDVAGVKMFECFRTMKGEGAFAVDIGLEFRFLAIMHEMICRQLDQQAKEKTGPIRFDLIHNAIRNLEVMARCETICGESLHGTLEGLRIFLEEGGAS